MTKSEQLMERIKRLREKLDAQTIEYMGDIDTPTKPLLLLDEPGKSAYLDLIYRKLNRMFPEKKCVQYYDGHMDLAHQCYIADNMNTELLNSLYMDIILQNMADIDYVDPYNYNKNNLTCCASAINMLIGSHYAEEKYVEPLTVLLVGRGHAVQGLVDMLNRSSYVKCVTCVGHQADEETIKVYASMSNVIIHSAPISVDYEYAKKKLIVDVSNTLSYDPEKDGDAFCTNRIGSLTISAVCLRYASAISGKGGHI